MVSIYVSDTSSIIRYFKEVFRVNENLSLRARLIIEATLVPYDSSIKLSIPSVVFVEIFDKFFHNEELAQKIRYEVFRLIATSPNIEIKSIDNEVLENVLKIGGKLSRHDINDKIIVASAMMLNCPLITTDEKIIDFIRTSGTIPTYIS